MLFTVLNTKSLSLHDVKHFSQLPKLRTNISKIVEYTIEQSQLTFFLRLWKHKKTKQISLFICYLKMQCHKYLPLDKSSNRLWKRGDKGKETKIWDEKRESFDVNTIVWVRFSRKTLENTNIVIWRVCFVNVCNIT